LWALATTAVVAERARARATFARREAMATSLVEEHAALHAVTALVARGADLTDLCSLVAQSAATLLSGRVGLVLRFDSAGHGELVGRCVNGIEGYPECGQRLPFEPGSAIGTVLAAGRTARVAPMAPSPFQRHLGERLATPIEIEGHLWGAVAVAGTQDHPLAPDSEERIERFAELVALAIANAEAREQLLVQARTDALTGVANHRAFQEHLEQEARRAREAGRPLALIVFDVDRFKSVNDSGGHLAGDEVLSEVARRIAVSTGPGAVVGRLGGDEFAALLPGCDAAAGRLVAERARRLVAAEPVGPQRVTISAGVSDLAVATNPRELLKSADDALYRAKALGRDACLQSIPQTSIEV
jgi:diguanylate cyclase (GGDEF)-like protein